MDTIVIDLDRTLTMGDTNDYVKVSPNTLVIEKLKLFKKKGFNVIIFTARNMRTYKNDIAAINANTLPIIIDWLVKHQVPYDGIMVGKPWCGKNGFYVDDKTIRPSEFASKSLEEIQLILKKEEDFLQELL